MTFKTTSDIQKLVNQISFTKYQLRGWEDFLAKVKDPNNILRAKQEIAINTKTLAALEANRIKLSDTNTQNPH